MAAFEIQQAEGTRWNRITTGERTLRVYEGKGRLLRCTSPYWRFKVMQVYANKHQAPQTHPPADLPSRLPPSSPVP
jgi:hypothetical protein